MTAEKQVALITGAARGIGRATALEFARRGYDVAVLDVLRDELQEVAAALEQLGGQVLPQQVDVADLDAAQAAVRQTADRFGRLDVLVNNAAWRELQTMRELSVDSWEKTLRICLTAPAFLSRWAAEIMERQQKGVIIHVSSMMSQRGGGVSPAYVAAKGGLDSLTYELAALYGPSGIRVLTVNPGAIDTDLSRDYPGAAGGTSRGALRSWGEDAIPLRRWGQAEEVARAIVMLAGEDASYVTGANLLVDGGWLHSHLPRSLLEQMMPEQFRR